METKCIITSFSFEILQNVNRIYPKLKRAFVGDTLPSVEFLVDNGFSFADIRFSILTSQFIKKAKCRGILIDAWTIDEKRDMLKAIEMGVLLIDQIYL